MKNTFRDEVEASEVNPAEEMKRNQAVHLLYLQAQKTKSTADDAHLRSSICLFEAFKLELSQLPDCDYKTAVLGIVDQQIEQHGRAVEATQFNGISAMTLDALERLAEWTEKDDLGRISHSG